jgi:3-deoxy-manno-octulosonate cytidylyltransferase (CMP-KDO synthetase)
MNTAIVIPARLASSRFPNKMLCDVGGKTLIRHVYDQCLTTGYDVYVATDSEEIASQVENAIIVPDAENGTERIAFMVEQIPQYKAIINVQGDMVRVPVEDLPKLTKLLEKYHVATLKHPMKPEQQLDSNTVKVISTSHQAHWFCRAALPYGDWHYGIYGYHPALLKNYPTMNKHPEEDIESLEQLRWLQNGYTIGVAEAGLAAEINTPEDLENYLNSQRK